MFLVISIELSGQSTILDSLKIALDQRDVLDTSLVKIRLDYIKHSIHSSPADSTLLNFALETLEQASLINYSKGEILANQRVGVILQYFLSRPLVALEYYQNAVTLIDQNPEHKQLMQGSLNNIATIYAERKDYQQALEIYRQIVREYNGQSIPERYLGIVFGELDQLDSSIYYFEVAIKRALETNNTAIEANCLSNLSLIFSRVDRMEDAISSVERALHLVDSNQIDIIRPTAYLNASEVYLKTGQFDLAEFYALEALSIPALKANLFVQKSIYATLYDVYKATERFESALRAHERFKDLNDSLTSIDQRVAITKKDLEFESERRQIKAEAEIRRQLLINRIYLVVGLAILALGAFISFLIWQKRKSFHKAKEAEFNREIAESRLIALRTQLDPHFIFNSIGAIDQYMITNGVEKASVYLTKFSSLMRRILENSNHDWVSLADEIELMRWYVDINKLRLSNGLTLNVQIDPEINAEHTLVPSLFIQPFIENSIKHGLAKKDGPGTISVIASITIDDKFLFVIEDDGIGLSMEAENKKRASLGSKIAQSRINYLNYLSHNDATFETQELEQGFRVTFTIPYKQKF